MAYCKICGSELATGKALSFSKAENGFCGDCVNKKTEEMV